MCGLKQAHRLAELQTSVSFHVKWRSKYTFGIVTCENQYLGCIPPLRASVLIWKPKRANEFTPMLPNPGRNDKLQVSFRSGGWSRHCLVTVLSRTQYRVHMQASCPKIIKNSESRGSVNWDPTLPSSSTPAIAQGPCPERKLI